MDCRHDDPYTPRMGQSHPTRVRSSNHLSVAEKTRLTRWGLVSPGTGMVIGLVLGHLFW